MRLRPTLFVLLAVATCWVAPRPASAADEARPAPARVVYLVGQLPDEDLIALTSAVAVADPPPVVLLETPGTAAYLKGFFAAYRPDRVVPVGSFADTAEERERRLGVTLAPGLTWKAGPPGPLFDAL